MTQAVDARLHASMLAAASPHELCFEDVTIGENRETPWHTVEWTHIQEFAALTHDRTPLHTDAAFCLGTPFGRPIAHGLLCLALMEGLKSELELFTHTNVASVGWDRVRFRSPVTAGDELQVRFSFIRKADAANRYWGMVTEAVRLVNRDGKAVTDGQHSMLILRRAARDQ